LVTIAGIAVNNHLEHFLNSHLVLMKCPFWQRAAPVAFPTGIDFIKRNPLCLKQRVHQPHVAVVIIAFCHLFQYITTISFRIRQVLLP